MDLEYLTREHYSKLCLPKLTSGQVFQESYLEIHAAQSLTKEISKY